MKLFNSINEYFLKRYPVIWNLRIVLVLIVLAVLHFLFFLAGYAEASLKELHDIQLFSEYFESPLVVFGIMISFLVLVGWLWFYTRNNALRRMLPKTSLSLWLEFLGTFVIIFASISFYFSFTLGVKSQINTLHTKAELTQSIDQFNMGSAFVITDDRTQKFALNKGCMQTPVFDSLVSDSALFYNLTDNDYRRIFGFNDYSSQDYTNFLETKNYTMLKDSIELKGINKNELDGYREVLFDRLYGSNNSDDLVDVASDSGKLIKSAQIRGTHQEKQIYSVWNFCHTQIYSNKTQTGDQYAQRVHNILENSPDSITYYQQSMLKLADEYGLKYNFQKNNLEDYMGSAPYYLVHFFDGHLPYYDTDESDYFEFANLEDSLEQESKAKFSSFDTEAWLIHLYIALVAALALFSYRIVGIRVWFLSLVFAIGIVIFYNLATFAVIFNLVGGINESIALLFLLLLFVLSFNFIAFKHKSFLNSKGISGYALSWSIITSPALFVLVYFIVLELFPDYEFRTYDSAYSENDLEKTHPVRNFLENFTIPFFYLNILLSLALAYFYGKLGKSWVAKPKAS